MRIAITPFGWILEFDKKLEHWIPYSERLEHFSLLSTSMILIKRVILLIVIGPKAYKLLQSLVAPERLEYKSCTDIVEAMKMHHNPDPSEIVQWHQFFSRFRQQGESFQHLHLHINFSGPFNGQMFLVLIDALSKWLEVHPLPMIMAQATSQHLWTIFAQFGLPERIVSDNGHLYQMGI